MDYKNIIVTGSIAYDRIMDFPDKFQSYFQLDKLHQINISFVVNKLEVQIGGIASNISYGLSLLTKKKVVVLGAVGKDGQKILKFYKKHGIETENIISDKKDFTSTGTVITDIKDNQIWGFYYGVSYLASKIGLKKFISKENLFILSANHAKSFIHFQKFVIKHRLDYLYDPGMAVTFLSKDDLRQGLINARFVVGNDYEIGNIIKKSGLKIKDLTKKGVDVITTLGDNGVKLESRYKNFRVLAFKTIKVVDPTGAGDAWRAGFIAGFVANKEIKQCLAYGNVLASFAVEKYGTVNYKLSQKDFIKRVTNILV